MSASKWFIYSYPIDLPLKQILGSSLSPSKRTYLIDECFEVLGIYEDFIRFKELNTYFFSFVHKFL